MIGDQHDVAGLEIRIDAAGRICNNQRLDSQSLHHADRQSDLRHRVTLVEVHATLHDHDAFRVQLSKEQSAAVTYNGGCREVWDILERHDLRSHYGIRYTVKP